MIVYFSGTGYASEKLFKEKANIMMSFFLSRKNPQKRLLKICKKRKKRKRT